MPTGISSVFAIVSSDDIAAGQTLTITNPGRTLKVMSLRIKGAGNASVTVQKGDSGAGGTTFATGAVGDSVLEGWTECDVNGLQSELTATNEIRVTSNAGGGTITAIAIECIGNPQQSLTSSVA